MVVANCACVLPIPFSILCFFFLLIIILGLGVWWVWPFGSSPQRPRMSKAAFAQHTHAYQKCSFVNKSPADADSNREASPQLAIRRARFSRSTAITNGITAVLLPTQRQHISHMAERCIITIIVRRRPSACINQQHQYLMEHSRVPHDRYIFIKYALPPSTIYTITYRSTIALRSVSAKCDKILAHDFVVSSRSRINANTS